MSRLQRFLLVIWCEVLGMCLAGASVPARGDVFVLKSGARVRGEWLNAGESPIRRYIIQHAPDVKLTLTTAQVTEHIRESAEISRYEQWAPTVPDTAAEQWRIAEWCREQGLKEQQRQHLWRVIELDPDHDDARIALGFSEIDGKWTTTKDFYLERGFVYYQGKWRLPQEVDVIEERRRIERLERDWFGRLKTLRSQLGTERDEEALKSLAAIQDPHALKALADYLHRERNPRVRELFVCSIANIRTAAAVELLLRTALHDPDVEVFHTSVDKLLAHPVPGLSRKLTDSLRDPHNLRVNRAAHILGRLGDRTAIPALAAALVTTHHVVVPPNRGTAATFVHPVQGGGVTTAGASTPMAPMDGGMAFTAGKQPNILAYPVANQEVLSALVKLSGGHSFGFEERAWLNWWASASRAPPAK